MDELDVIFHARKKNIDQLVDQNNKEVELKFPVTTWHMACHGYENFGHQL